MFLRKSSCSVGLFLLLTCAVLAAHCALEPAMAAAADHYGGDSLEGKINEDNTLNMMQKRPSFFVGSRYGRSGQSSPLFAPSKTRRLNVVARNDRFFLGSRYGKRAGEYMSPYYEQDSAEGATAAAFSSMPSAAAAAGSNVIASNSKSASLNSQFMMSCIYTGVKNFYRCNNIAEINNIINQLTAGQNDDDNK